MGARSERKGGGGIKKRKGKQRNGKKERKTVGGTWRRALASALFLAFLFTETEMKSMNSFDHLPFFDKVGALLEGIKKRALIGCKSYRGGAHSAISIAVIPIDQISAFSSYKLPSPITSGAIL